MTKALKALGSSSAYFLSPTFAPKAKPKSKKQSHDYHRNYSQEIQASDETDSLKANFKFLRNMHFGGK